MATLLQQKNYMKSLSNGGVGGGGTGNQNNGTTAAVTSTTLQPTRMLLPHEIVNAPTISNVTTSLQSPGIMTQSGTGYIMTGQTLRINQPPQLQHYAIQTTNHHNQFQTPINLQQYTTSNNFFQQIGHQGPNTIFLPVSIASNNNIKFTNVNTSINSVVPANLRNVINVTSQPQIYQHPHTTMATIVTSRPPQLITSVAGPSTQFQKINRQPPKIVNKPIVEKVVIEKTAAEKTAVTKTIIEKPVIEKQPIVQKTVTEKPFVEKVVAEKPVVQKSVPEKTEHKNETTNSEPIKNVQEERNCDTNTSPPAQTQEGKMVEGETEEAKELDAEPEIDIVINNVVCSFSVRCHLNLREIALNGFNVEYRRQNAMVTMKLRRPYTTASIWSSGRITCTGATSEEQAKIAARRYSRCLQKLGFRVRFHNFRVVNVLGTCSMPWAIKIVNFSEKYKKEASYEPELHPGVTYKIITPKATMKIFSTGSITVTAASVADVQAAIEHIYPLVYEFRKKRTNFELELLHAKHSIAEEEEEDEDFYDEDDYLQSRSAKRKRPLGRVDNDPDEDIMNVSGNEDFDDGDDIEDY
uniref:TATA box-binding protein-like 1 n=1 Tax=Tabanus bromius TaxID=304241 RepID=A0A0K8TKU0_TABBR